jgi:GNAT superfamily N-acetyltransferase
MVDYDISDFNGLIKIIEEDCGKKCNAHINYDNNLIINSGGADLYIRLRNKKRITIARIAFNNHRRGYGTKVLEWLKKLALSKGIYVIIMEQTTNIEVCRFCAKNGFQKILNGYSESTDGVHWGNWELRLDDD